MVGPDVAARVLGAARRARGLTQEDLSEATGVSVRTIRELERGRVTVPRRSTLHRLADALELTTDDRALLTTASPVRGGAVPPPAAQLPPPLRDLVGRDDEIARIRSHARAVARDGAGPRVVALHGPAGVGKTSLAVGVAAQVRGDLADGQLFVDLRGDGTAPLTPGDVLASFLRALGAEPAAVPTDVEGRAALFRTLTERLRLVVVLDNGAGEEQVRPLLPAGPHCLVLTTSRRPLLGLAACDLLAVDLLTHTAARELLTTVVGERTRAEPDACGRLVELCDGLPLALRIAAHRLASRPTWRVAHLVEQLGDERRRLSALTVGDLGVRAALDVSYAQLDDVAADVLRSVALVPGATFGPELAAVAADVDEHTAAHVLDALVDVGLLLCTAERYRFHDLVRLYVREQAERRPAHVRRAVVDRVVGWLLRRTIEAGRVLDAEGTEEVVRRLGRGEALRRRADATAWLDAESTNWLAALREGVHLGRRREVVAATRALHWYSDGAAHRHPWAEVFALGADAAQEVGDAESEAVLRNFTAWALYLCLERYDDAHRELDRALAVARSSDITREEAWALTYRSAVALRTGVTADHLPAAEQAVAIFADLGHELGHESALTVLGLLLGELGRYAEALDLHRQVDASYRRRRSRGAVGTDVGEAYTGLAMAGDLAGLGRTAEAATVYARTRRGFRHIGDTYGEAVVAHRQGLLLVASDPQGAVEAQSAAVELFAGVGAVSWELRARQALDAARRTLDAARRTLDAARRSPGDR